MKLTFKRAAFMLLLPFLSLACQSTTTPQQAPLAEFRNELEIGLPVFGMSCPKCANNITLQLIELDGVVTVDVDMGRGFVTVQAEPGKVPTRAAFVEAVTAAGFIVPANAPTPTVNIPRVQEGPSIEE